MPDAAQDRGVAKGLQIRRGAKVHTGRQRVVVGVGLDSEEQRGGGANVFAPFLRKRRESLDVFRIDARGRAELRPHVHERRIDFERTPVVIDDAEEGEPLRELDARDRARSRRRGTGA